MQSLDHPRNPRFLYFDLGMVLVNFTFERMCQQVAAVCGLPWETVYRLYIGSPLQHQYETGQVDTAQCHAAFCELTGTRSECGAWAQALSDIFELNLSMVPVVAQLRAAGYGVGLLSNTCPGHWELIRARYRLIRETFHSYALSYQIGATKPDPAIFAAAARLAGVEPQEVFFTDDTPGHVDAARAAGFDAVTYTTTEELVAQLRQRGIQFNY